MGFGCRYFIGSLKQRNEYSNILGSSASAHWLYSVWIFGAERHSSSYPMARETDESSPPNKRLKTLNSQIEHEPPPETENSPPDRCAICFLDDGKVAQGKIDCCDHYYCFLCIKEWAKTESRCPMCRRRFSTICRPPKHGVFVRERVVKVPVRDQVSINS